MFILLNVASCVLLAVSVIFVDFTLDISWVAGPILELVVMTIAMVQLVRQRRDYLQGYPEHVKIRADPPRPTVAQREEGEEDVVAPPLYQNPNFSSLFQDEFSKEPIPSSSAPATQQHRIGDFEYDKP
jgi:hypothetical protein